MESWHEKMFEIMQRVPPNNCAPVTMMQAKEADKMLWKKMAESIRGSILIRSEFALLVNDPEVQFLMMPMPTWRIPPLSKWLVTMVSKSPKWGYSPYKWPKWLINGGY